MFNQFCTIPVSSRL